MTTARAVIDELISASETIDGWDAEFSPAPYHLHSDATARLQELDASEREVIVALLDDPSVRVRREAAHACSVLTLASAEARLVRGLRDADSDVRDNCATALLAIVPTETLAYLAAAGPGVSTWLVDQAAVQALERLGEKVVPLLVQAGHNPSVIVSGENVWYALYDRYPDVVAPVLERGLREASFEWCVGTMRLLKRRGGGRWVRPVLTWLAKHRDTRLASMATEVLGSFGDAGTVDTLLETLRGAQDRYARATIIDALFRLSATTKLPVAAHVIERCGPSDRAALMSGLASLVDASWEQAARNSITKAVRGALLDSSEEVVTEAIRAAVTWRLASVADAVIATLGHPRWYARNLSDARRDYTKQFPAASSIAVISAIERGLSTTATPEQRELATNATHTLAEMPDAATHGALLRRALAVRDKRLCRRARARHGRRQARCGCARRTCPRRLRRGSARGDRRTPSHR